MKKVTLTLQVNSSTIAALRSMAEQKGVLVRRGPGSGHGSVAKLLDRLALDYLLQELTPATAKQERSRSEQKGEEIE